MNDKSWMIYGANGYTGELIAREAAKRGLKPVLAGRSPVKIKMLADELSLPFKIFALDNSQATAEALQDQYLVLHCAGPFSATAEPMMAGCIKSQTHYLDITGEISVYELARSLNQEAEQAEIVLCPGVGFDVIPTDCVAAKLKQLLPDASHLTLGFDSRSVLSPGTAKTSVEGLSQGGKIRQAGKIISVPLAYQTRKIDFGDGEKLAMTIPWGDVSTAYFTTQIPNIEVYIPAPPKLIKKLQRLNSIRFILGVGFVQNFLKKQIDKKVKGPDEAKRKSLKTYVWGEARNDQGQTKSIRITTANGYALTITGSLFVVDFLLKKTGQSGYTTPAVMINADLITSLPGSGDFVID